MDRKWQKDRLSELSFSQGNREYLSLRNIRSIKSKARGQRGEPERVPAGTGRAGRDLLGRPLQAGRNLCIHPFGHCPSPLLLPNDGSGHVIADLRLRRSDEDIGGTRCTAAGRQRYLDLKNHLLLEILRALESDSERKGVRWKELKSQA